jgi:hypothetical protein
MMISAWNSVSFLNHIGTLIMYSMAGQQVEQQKPKFYQPGNWERYWLVVSGMYSNLSEVPEMIK